MLSGYHDDNAHGARVGSTDLPNQVVEKLNQNAGIG